MQFGPSVDLFYNIYYWAIKISLELIALYEKSSKIQLKIVSLGEVHIMKNWNTRIVQA